MEKCLENLSHSYPGCEEEISELIYQINQMMNEKREEWESSYNSLFEQCNQHSKLISDYKLLLEDKDVEISDLRNEISVIDKSNYERRMILESKISELSKSIRSSKSQFGDKSPNSMGTQELTISALKKEAEYYKDKIAELEVVQTTHNTQIHLLEEQRTTLLKKNEELKQKHNKCRKEYHAKLEEANREIEMLETAKVEFAAKVTEFKKLVTQKDVEIDNVKETLQEVLASNQKNNSSFHNMQKELNLLQTEKENVELKLKSVEAQNHRLVNDKKELLATISNVEQNVEDGSNRAKSEVGVLKTQLEISSKENEFLRSFLLHKDNDGKKSENKEEFFDRLEADNNSLKENIHSMEKEIGTLIKLTEQSYRKAATFSPTFSPTSTKSEVHQVKERYERHLQNMKTEIEQLRLENLSLKISHPQQDNSMIFSNQSNNTSFIDDLSQHDFPSKAGSIKDIEDRVSHKSPDIEDRVSHKSPDIEDVSVKSHDMLEPPHTPLSVTKSDSHLMFRTSPMAKSLPGSPSVRTEPLHGGKSPGKSPHNKSFSNDVILREFEILQNNVLKQFEQRLNECALSFNTGL